MIVGDVLELKCVKCGKTEQFKLCEGCVVRMDCVCSTTVVTMSTTGVIMRIMYVDEVTKFPEVG